MSTAPEAAPNSVSPPGKAPRRAREAAVPHIGVPTRLDRLHGQRDQTWRTPRAVYDALNAEFGFTLDPCHAGSIWDGTALSWIGERVYCNPPYRHGSIERWLAKAREADVAVYLLPSRTGTAWWHDYALGADEIRFIRGRLRFGGSKITAPEWSVILVYRGASLGGASDT